MAHHLSGLIFCLVFAFIQNATAVCKISLSPDVLGINVGFWRPLIYVYKSDGTPVVRYPSADSYCVFHSQDQRLHLACPGYLNTVNLYLDGGVGQEVGTVNTTSNSVYLLHDPSNNTRVLIHGELNPFPIVRGNYAKCSYWVDASMYLLNTTEVPSLGSYVVGYRLNDVELLKFYEQVFIDEEWIVTRYRINPVIRNRPKFNIDDSWERGLFYRTKYVNFAQLYSKEYQIAEFQRHFGDLELTGRYFGGNNSLVKGQLLFDEDMFYYSEVIGTHYYENTAPIWASVYEGNWRAIGGVIRKIADETARELDVYASAWPSYQASDWSQTWALGNTSSSPDVIIPVPLILVKAAVDVDNHNRGVVFHTFNDPHLDPKTASEQWKDYCSATIDCKNFHPEFRDVFKGYTFCCSPRDSNIFKEKFDL